MHDGFEIDRQGRVGDRVEQGHRARHCGGARREGCHLVLTGTDEAALKDAAAAVTAHGRKAKTVAIDLRKDTAPATLTETVQSTYGRLDILVNNAGTTKRGDFLTLTDADWADGYALKFFAHVRLSRAAWPLLTASDGSVVGIAGIGAVPAAEFAIGSSVNAACWRSPRRSPMSARRMACRSTASIRAASKPSGCGGAFARRVTDTGDSEAKVREDFQKEFNITRFGLVDDIAGLVTFIASPHGRWMHGAIIDMDGGEVSGV